MDGHLHRAHPNYKPFPVASDSPPDYPSWEVFFKELSRQSASAWQKCPLCRHAAPPARLITHLGKEHGVTIPAAQRRAAKTVSGESPTRSRNPQGQGLQFVSLDQLQAQENEGATPGWGPRYRERGRFGSPVMYDDHGDE
jgi:hypothetical protein